MTRQIDQGRWRFHGEARRERQEQRRSQPSRPQVRAFYVPYRAYVDPFYFK